MKKILAMVLAVAMTAAMVVGCGSSAPADNSAAAGGESAGKIAYITNASINDGGWNQSLYGAMEACAAEFGLETSYAENTAESDYVATFSNYANMGNNLIFAPGNEYTDAVIEVAASYPDVCFIIFNGDVSGDNYISIKADNVEMGFLAGVVAGLVTKTNQLGYIGAEEITTSIDCVNGYEQGAKYVNDAAEVTISYTGSWTDSAKGKEIALSMMSTKDADVFFGNAGQVDVGVREGCAEFGDDRYGIAQPAESLSENPDVVLTSTIVDHVALIGLAIADWQAGTFGNQVYIAGAADGVLTYGEFGNNAKDIKDKAMEAYDKLVAGEIELSR